MTRNDYFARYRDSLAMDFRVLPKSVWSPWAVLVAERSQSSRRLLVADTVEKVENGGAPKTPVCNRVDAFTEPELPDDFVVDRRARGDWD